jgi:hypothetical protein
MNQPIDPGLRWLFDQSIDPGLRKLLDHSIDMGLHKLEVFHTDRLFLKQWLILFL